MGRDRVVGVGAFAVVAADAPAVAARVVVCGVREPAVAALLYGAGHVDADEYADAD
ncbi:MAG: hypothetical protein FWE21_03955 [Defluviitaleaceae bacterium]|nr:hypothetical protein [Defluviitaleaceae bacterium]